MADIDAGGGGNWEWAMRYMTDMVGKKGKGLPGGQGGGPGSRVSPGDEQQSDFSGFNAGGSAQGNFNMNIGGPNGFTIGAGAGGGAGTSLGRSSVNGGSPIAGGVSAVSSYLSKGFSGRGWTPESAQLATSPSGGNQDTMGMIDQTPGVMDGIDAPDAGGLGDIAGGGIGGISA
jgi:hypothetical protein